MAATSHNSDTVEKGNERTTIRVDRLLARDGDTFVFVDKLFHDGRIHGATGSRMAPVTREEMDRREDQMRDYEWSGLAHIYEESDPDQSWDEWIDEQLRIEGDRLLYDPSYEVKYGEIVREKASKELGYDKDNIAAVECVGGGRMFDDVDREYDRIYDPVLMAAIQDAESEDPDWIRAFEN